MVTTGSEGKASAFNEGDLGSNPKSEKSLGEGNGSPLQYSCLENSMGGGAWYPIVYGIAKCHTQLRNFISFFLYNITKFCT